MFLYIYIPVQQSKLFDCKLLMTISRAGLIKKTISAQEPWKRVLLIGADSAPYHTCVVPCVYCTWSEYGRWCSPGLQGLKGDAGAKGAVGPFGARGPVGQKVRG